MHTKVIFLVCFSISSFCYGHNLHNTIKDKIGTLAKTAAWKNLGWKAEADGSMTLSLLQKFKVPLKSIFHGKGDIDPFRRVRSCTDIKNRYPDATSKVYTIYPDGKTPKLAYCDMVTEGGGWTVFQRRTDGSVDFYRGWSDYKSGFGNTSNEYWLGNEAIHKLTENGTCVLRIDMVTRQNERGFSKFTNFTISSEDVGYKMDYDRYYGAAGETAFAYHKGMKFSTKDVDNDKKGSNCAQEYTGAWWYNACHNSNLNGKHGGSGNTNMRWWDWKDTKKDAFMKETIMMIKC